MSTASAVSASSAEASSSASSSTGGGVGLGAGLGVGGGVLSGRLDGLVSLLGLFVLHVSSLRSSGVQSPTRSRRKTCAARMRAATRGCQAAAMRASRWEILGAWLRVWTPPRDVEIPPIPWRAVALLGVACVAAVVAVIVLLVAPALDRSKERGAASEQRREAAARRAPSARGCASTSALQTRPRAARGAPVPRGGRRAAAQAALRAPRARERPARRARPRRGGRVRASRCAPCAAARAAGGAAPRVRLSCFAVTTQNAPRRRRPAVPRRGLAARRALRVVSHQPAARRGRRGRRRLRAALPRLHG